MLCRNNRSCVHSTTLGSDAVGQTQNQQRSTRAHRRSHTRATIICTGIWNTSRQIISARRRSDTEDWKIPILLYNSDPCTNRSTDCKCNPVIIPARTRVARVEEIQAIQHIGTRETERSAGECALPPHLLDAASDLNSDHRARAADLLAKHIDTFPAPATPITGRTEAVMHEIDTGSTRPIHCNPRKLSPKKIKITTRTSGHNVGRRPDRT